jgi:hypothetical protein
MRAKICNWLKLLHDTIKKLSLQYALEGTPYIKNDSKKFLGMFFNAIPGI